MSHKVLLIDDDVPLTRTVERILAAAGMRPLLAYTAEDGLHMARQQQPDLVLLDIMLPVMGGWQLCQQLRDFSDVPVIFLTALGGVQNVVHGLEVGGDDYIVKPFVPEEFLARVRAHLRRQRQSAEQQQRRLTLGDSELHINLVARSVDLDGRPMELTPREFELLVALARNAGRVVTADGLARQAWGMDDDAAAENVKPYIHYLRKKIEADPTSPRWIQTVRGIGYRFAE
jgi:DNA-binding response OmpR family regulator